MEKAGRIIAITGMTHRGNFLVMKVIYFEFDDE